MRKPTPQEQRLNSAKGVEAKRTGETKRARLEAEVMALRAFIDRAMKLLGEAAELGQGEDWADDLRERIEDLELELDAIEVA